MSYGVIYLITNKLTGKQYVGQTTGSIKNRFRSHATSHNMYIGRSIIQYGVANFSIIEVAKASNRDELHELEKHYIAVYNTLVPNGYNRTSGGVGNLTRLPEFTAYKLSGTRTKPVLNSLGFIWEFLNEAATTLDLEDPSRIGRCLRKEINYYNGYVFASTFEKEDDLIEQLISTNEASKFLPWDDFIAVDHNDTELYNGNSIRRCCEILAKQVHVNFLNASGAVQKLLDRIGNSLHGIRFVYLSDLCRLPQLKSNMLKNIELPPVFKILDLQLKTIIYTGNDVDTAALQIESDRTLIYKCLNKDTTVIKRRYQVAYENEEFPVPIFMSNRHRSFLCLRVSTGEILGIFEKQKPLAVELGIPYQRLSHILNKNETSYKDFTFIYEDLVERCVLHALHKREYGGKSLENLIYNLKSVNS